MYFYYMTAVFTSKNFYSIGLKLLSAQNKAFFAT